MYSSRLHLAFRAPGRARQPCRIQCHACFLPHAASGQASQAYSDYRQSLIAGGWLSDFFQQRGRRDGHLRTALVSALATVPFVIAFPIAPSAALSVAALAGAVFFGTMAFGAGPALIPVICPARMRGLLVALYLLVANLVGQAGGPWIVAVFTDYVFGAPELVKYSLLVVPSALLLLGAALIAAGFPGLRALQERAA